MPQIRKDIEYALNWYAQRKGKLEFVDTYQEYHYLVWKRMPFPTTFPITQPAQRKGIEIFQKYLGPIMCDPSIDRCSAKTWHKAIEQDATKW